MLSNIKPERIQDPATRELVSFLISPAFDFNDENAVLHLDFPIYRDDSGLAATAKILLLSKEYGVTVMTATTAGGNLETEAQDQLFSDVEQILSLMYSRLIRNKSLRKSSTMLSIPIHSFVFAPNISSFAKQDAVETALLRSSAEIEGFFEAAVSAELSSKTFSELLSTAEGAKGIIPPRKRDLEGLGEESRGRLAAKAEAEICCFDRTQRHGAITVLNGPQRIRGLAGSGKTVVLAMKAALTHLRNPEARVVYTFNTKSLYQHIRRLITRFYRQFHDQDPDWNFLKVMHAWGGQATPGVYSEACQLHQMSPVTYGDVSTYREPFDTAIELLTKDRKIRPIYDYIFIDEGQDFPVSFIRLCSKLTSSRRMVWAYDEFQTLFETVAPSIAKVLGDEGDEDARKLEEDTVLHKCYRNPREILVLAHALGMGIYSKRIVQMLENEEHWQDIGYNVVEGEFKQGSQIVIDRPIENSLASLSDPAGIDEIVKMTISKDYESELESVVKGVRADLDSGLLPHDVMVIGINDYAVKEYLFDLSVRLRKAGIEANNVHGDSFSLRDFAQEGKVTLTTVHKAKGNESHSVHIAGIGALFRRHTVRNRNVIFCGMTRAKGWIALYGSGDGAEQCKSEIDAAKAAFPTLRFKYPSDLQIKVMKRDLERSSIEKMRSERLLDAAMEGMSRREIEDYLDYRESKRSARRKPRR